MLWFLTVIVQFSKNIIFSKKYTVLNNINNVSGSSSTAEQDELVHNLMHSGGKFIEHLINDFI